MAMRSRRGRAVRRRNPKIQSIPEHSEIFTDKVMEEKYNDEPVLKLKIIKEYQESKPDPEDTTIIAVEHGDVLELKEAEPEEKKEIMKPPKNIKPVQRKLKPVEKLVNALEALEVGEKHIVGFLKKNKSKINRLSRNDRVLFMNAVAFIYH